MRSGHVGVNQHRDVEAGEPRGSERLSKRRRRDGTERDAAHAERRPADGAGLDQSFEAMVEKYGEDNARFLMEFQNQWVDNYTTAAYIKMPISPPAQVEAEARKAADSHGWEFEVIQGDDRLIQALIDGDWGEEEFLIVPPGQSISPSNDPSILKAVPTA